MKIPRDLSGHDLASALCRDWGYRVVHQLGSHIVLETEEPSHHRIAVPNHKNLRIGTLSAIARGSSILFDHLVMKGQRRDRAF
jgi:predicted RNA binding protein YcfA (HicA-like mRNA interferase family)